MHESGDQLDRIARRYRPVFEGLALGLSIEEIAVRSSLAKHTVENYVSDPMKATGLNRVQLALAAARLLEDASG